MNLKKRIFPGWTWIRGAFLLIGMWMIMQATLEGEWLGIGIGSWLAIMGIFGLGCSAGNCFNGSCEVSPGNEQQNKNR